MLMLATALLLPSPNAMVVTNPSLSDPSSPQVDNMLPSQTDATAGGATMASLNPMQDNSNIIVANEHAQKRQLC